MWPVVNRSSRTNEEFTYSVGLTKNSRKVGDSSNMRRVKKHSKMEDFTLEFEAFQPCFFEEEDFYDGDTLGKDIWKKFELLPTPPRSPEHDPFETDTQEAKNPVDKNLQLVSQILDNEHPVSCTNLNLNLIQDCMWSAPGLAAAGILNTGTVKKPLKVVTDPETPGEKSVPTVTDINSAQCVDPAAVFPYPVSEASSPRHSQSPALSTVTETPSSSGSDLDSEDEEEIIDVVTVAEKIVYRQKPADSWISSQNSHVARMHNYSSSMPPSPPPSAAYSAPQSPSQFSHSPSLSSAAHKRCRPMSMPTSPQPAVKKQRSLLRDTDLKRVVQTDLNRVVQKLKNRHHDYHRQKYVSNSRQSSDDSEDCCDGTKRAQHNVLERKRRNDLKYSFLRLRDSVPDIQRLERTPKVSILKQSARHIHGLRTKHCDLEAELQKYQTQHEQLKRRLGALRKDLL